MLGRRRSSKELKWSHGGSTVYRTGSSWIGSMSREPARRPFREKPRQASGRERVLRPTAARRSSVAYSATTPTDATEQATVETFPHPTVTQRPGVEAQVVDELTPSRKTIRDQVGGWAVAAAPTAPTHVSRDGQARTARHPSSASDSRRQRDDTILTNYKELEPDLQKLNGGNVQLAGMEPVAGASHGTAPSRSDQKRMEVLGAAAGSR